MCGYAILVCLLVINVASGFVAICKSVIGASGGMGWLNICDKYTFGLAFTGG